MQDLNVVPHVEGGESAGHARQPLTPILSKTSLPRHILDEIVVSGTSVGTNPVLRLPPADQWNGLAAQPKTAAEWLVMQSPGSKDGFLILSPYQEPNESTGDYYLDPLMDGMRKRSRQCDETSSCDSCPTMVLPIEPTTQQAVTDVKGEILRLREENAKLKANNGVLSRQLLVRTLMETALSMGAEKEYNNGEDLNPLFSHVTDYATLEISDESGSSDCSKAAWVASSGLGPAILSFDSKVWDHLDSPSCNFSKETNTIARSIEYRRIVVELRHLLTEVEEDGPSPVLESGLEKTVQEALSMRHELQQQKLEAVPEGSRAGEDGEMILKVAAAIHPKLSQNQIEKLKSCGRKHRHALRMIHYRQEQMQSTCADLVNSANLHDSSIEHSGIGFCWKQYGESHMACHTLGNDIVKAVQDSLVTLNSFEEEVFKILGTVNIASMFVESAPYCPNIAAIALQILDNAGCCAGA